MRDNHQYLQRSLGDRGRNKNRNESGVGAQDQKEIIMSGFKRPGRDWQRRVKGGRRKDFTL